MTTQIRQFLTSITTSIFLAFFLFACSNDNGSGGLVESTPELLASSKTRDSMPGNTETELDLFVGYNNAFALDLYHAVGDEAENLFFSPYSISVALAMTWAGARNQTEAQMADTLHFNFSPGKLHSLYNEMDLDLSHRNANDPENSEKYLKLNICNEVWGQRDYSFLDTYLDTLMIHYGAGIRLVDFANHPEQSRLDINDWVAEKTENKIEDLLSPGDITDMARLVLTNTIYFNASWGLPFDPDQTYDGVFYLEDGATVTTPMMIPAAGSGKNGESFAAFEGSGYKAVALPYYNTIFSMIIVLPDAGTFESFEQGFDTSTLDEIVNHLEERDVALRMPAFECESRFNLSDTLSEMGMPDAFIPEVADFSGMDGTLKLFISKVIHQATITLDEAGTEAAAATAVIMELTAAPNPLEINVNRPFIYMIRDNQTGMILFLGRVKIPS